MSKLSKNFSRHEFACKCGCGFDSIDTETLIVLQEIRDHFDAPIAITSAARCASHNASVGGAPNSQHVLARAADFKVFGVAPDTVADWVHANYPTVSVGRYNTFTHADTRTDGPAYW